MRAICSLTSVVRLCSSIVHTPSSVVSSSCRSRTSRSTSARSARARSISAAARLAAVPSSVSSPGISARPTRSSATITPIASPLAATIGTPKYASMPSSTSIASAGKCRCTSDGYWQVRPPSTPAHGVPISSYDVSSPGRPSTHDAATATLLGEVSSPTNAIRASSSSATERASAAKNSAPV